jgi:hypothetical protein
MGSPTWLDTLIAASRRGDVVAVEFARSGLSQRPALVDRSSTHAKSILPGDL